MFELVYTAFTCKSNIEFYYFSLLDTHLNFVNFLQRKFRL